MTGRSSISGRLISGRWGCSGSRSWAVPRRGRAGWAERARAEWPRPSDLQDRRRAARLAAARTARVDLRASGLDRAAALDLAPGAASGLGRVAALDRARGAVTDRDQAAALDRARGARLRGACTPRRQGPGQGPALPPARVQPPEAGPGRHSARPAALDLRWAA